MKKIVIILIVLLVLAGAGGGAYYYFFMMNKGLPVAVEPEPEPEKAAEEVPPEPEVAPNMDFFVASDKLNVRSYPRINAPVRAVLRKGNAVKALEIKGEWARISDYQVHESGNDVADWIHTDFLSDSAPVITPEELRKSMLELVDKSDDFLLYEDNFITATRTLLDNGTCTYEDFELMSGWVLSRTFNIEPVYFVYCGGTERENKVYLNIETSEIFQP